MRVVLLAVIPGDGIGPEVVCEGIKVRVTVKAGDTLSGIAAALALPGGWPALYAANRRGIGPDPNTIRAGTVLTVPRASMPPSRMSVPGRRQHPASPPASGGGPQDDRIARLFG